MTVETLIAFNLTLLVSLLSPGPALLVALRTTLVHGPRGGISVGFGLALMAATWTLAALLGLEVVFELFPWAFGAMKTAGALYLLYFAWRTWRGAAKPLAQPGTVTKRAVRTGLMVNIANPKSVLFSAAVLLVIFPPDLAIGEKAFIVANNFALEFGFYCLLAAIMGRPQIRSRYLAAKAWLDRGTAVVLGALGLRLLIGNRG